MKIVRAATTAVVLFSVALASSSPAQVVTQLADIEPGENGSGPSELTASGGHVLFDASDSTHGNRIWRTDGTPAGTTPIFDPAPASTDGTVRYLVDVNGTVFFWSRPTNAGSLALWKTDGTTVGTVHVADLSPRELAGGSNSRAAMNGWLYFVLSNAGAGELWRSDGTTTEKVADLPSTEAYELVALAGRLYFLDGHQIWTSDGTAAGTYFLIDRWQMDPDLECPPWNLPYPHPGFPQCLLPPTVYQFFAEAGGVVFLALMENVGNDLTIGLWRTDGTVAGTTRIRTVYTHSFSMTTMNDTLYLTGEDPATGAELWTSDGTVAGTTLVADAVPGPESSYPIRLTAGDNTLWWTTAEWPASGHPTYSLWRSDGTGPGTDLIAELPQNYDDFHTFTIGDKVLLSITTPCFGRELWMSEGLSTGLRRVTNFDPEFPTFEIVADRVVLGNSLVFAGRGATGYEPYIYDGGTPSGDCGNGILEVGEVCDAGAGNGEIESCCSCSCVAVAAGTECNATGSFCGTQTCDGTSGECPADPLAECGDGNLDAGEGCDAGSQNGFSWNCCDCDCELVAAGTECRVGHEPCDPAEVCTGSDGECPVDVGEPDEDLDEICDPGDVCISQSRLGRPSVSLDARTDKGKIQTYIDVSSSAVDPVGHGIRVIVSAADQSETVLDVSVPGGAYDRVTRTGWRERLSPGASKWGYVNSNGFEGVTAVSIKETGSPGSLKLKVKLEGAALNEPLPAPLHVTVIADPPTANSTACADHAFVIEACTSDETGRKVRCR